MEDVCCCSAVAEGIPADNPHFVLLFFIAQLFLRELAKCHRLVQVIPMDMSGYYGKQHIMPTGSCIEREAEHVTRTTEMRNE